jgi:Caspase domain
MIKRRALLIGVWEYTKDPEKFPALRGPRHDLEALRKALVDPATGLFDPSTISVLANPTKADAEATIDTFFGEATRDDVLLFYYSGHGRLTLENQFYMCTTDTVERRQHTSGISAGTLRACLDSSQAETLVVILDCCHSGGFKGGDITELHGRGTFFLASTRERSLAADGDGDGPSPFTGAVVNALTSLASDKDGDGLITFDDVYREVDTMLRHLKQYPQRWVGEGQVVMAGRPQEDVTAITAPAAVTTPLPDSQIAKRHAEPSDPSASRDVERHDRDAVRWWKRLRRRHALAGGVGIGLAVALAVAVPLLFRKHPIVAPPEQWMLASDAPAVCRLPSLESFDADYLASPDEYARHFGRPITLNPVGADVCITERKAWASANCWYQVALDDDLEVAQMFNGGTEKSRCSLDTADVIFAEPPVRTASVESLLYQVGLVNARCASRREPCGGAGPACDDARVKAYEGLSHRGKALIQSAIAWRHYELDQLSVGAAFEGDDGKNLARSSLDVMEDKGRQLDDLFAIKPYEKSSPLGVTEREREQSDRMSSGSFCVPCIPLSKLGRDACK